MRNTARLFILLLLTAVMGLTCLTIGCGSDAPEEQLQSSYTVVFNSDGGTSVESQTVKTGKKVEKPANPTKEDSSGEYEFIGWFYDGKEWDFETDVVKRNLVLVAKWQATAIYTPEFMPE